MRTHIVVGFAVMALGIGSISYGQAKPRVVSSNSFEVLDAQNRHVCYVDHIEDYQFRPTTWCMLKLHPGGPGMLIRVNKTSIQGTHDLYYENEDCTGLSGIRDTFNLDEELFVPTAVAGETRDIYIPIEGGEIFDLYPVSFWNAKTGVCEFIDDGPEHQLVPVQKVPANYLSQFKPPYKMGK